MHKRTEHWKGRKKRFSRRYWHDLRVFSPGLWIVVCIVSTASLVNATESHFEDVRALELAEATEMLVASLFHDFD